MSAPANPFDVQTLEAAVDTAETSSQRVSALAQLGFAVSELGDSARGLRLTQEAYALGKTLDDDQMLWRATYYYATTFFRLARYAEALPLLHEALELARKGGQVTRQAISLDGIASLHTKLGELPVALELYEQCLELHRAAGRPDNEARTLNNLSRVYDEMGDFLRSRELREQVVAMLRHDQGNLLGFAGDLNNLGYSHLMLGEYEQAAERLEEAIGIARNLGGRHVEAYCLSNLAKLQDRLGHPAAALDWRQQALAQSREVGNQSLEAELLMLLGGTHRQLQQFEEAGGVLHQAMTIHERLGEQKGIAQVWLGLSEVAEAQQDLGAALEYHKRYREAERAVLVEEAERSARLLSARVEMEAARRETQMHREEKVKLAQAYDALRKADAERQELLARLEHQAHHDSLTGLGNRRAFDLAFDQIMSAAHRHGEPFGLMMIDLDGLKALNDGEGHARGDGLLISFAQALRESFRNEDQLFRLGGDEYAILLHRAEMLGETAVLERLQRTVEETRQMGYSRMDASAGVVFFPRDGIAGAGLLRLADERMYTCKAERKLRAFPT